jgi:hypothetical protein
MGHTMLSVPEGDGTSGEAIGHHSRPEDGAQPWSPSRWQGLLDGATTESGIRRKALETYPAMVWLCKLHWLGLASPRPGADAQLDHFLAWLEKLAS